MFMHRNVLAAFALLAALVLLPSTAFAKVDGWTTGKGSSRPSMKDLIPRMSADEAYSERYGFSVDLDTGGHIGFDFTISNLGWGDAHGAAGVRVELPGKKKYKFRKKKDEGDWSYAKDRFNIEIAGTSVRGSGKKFKLRHNGRVKVNLTFENAMPMWRPGNGQITTDEGYYKFSIIAPRANVSGTVEIDGEKIEVKGTMKGYGDHVATNIAPFDFAKRFSRFRHYNGDVFVVWREITLTNGKSFTWLMVGYKDKIVFGDGNAKIRTAKAKKDGAGYTVPWAVQIDGKKGGDSVQLVMRAKKQKRRDLLKSYGSAAKLVASTVSKPYQYDMDCEYTLKMTIGGAAATIKGRSHYILDYVNP
jgi:hypothetical protein